MRLIAAMLCVCFFISCSSDDGPKPPEAANLIFPEQNSECTTGIDQSDTTSEVEFRWQESANTSSYELRVTNMITNVTSTANTLNIRAPLTIEKGAPYSWVVISENSDNETATSATWQFYNAGSQTSYAPFPASIQSPSSGTTVVIDGNGEVTLAWTGADVDNDLSAYDVFHGTVNPPTELAISTLVGETNIKIAVQPDTYYWRVVSKDSQGNTSDSGVYSYKAL